MSSLTIEGGTMPVTDPATIATRCLGAWTTGDLATVRTLVRDDVTVEGPLGATEGVDNYVSGLQELAKFVTGVEQKRVLVDGDDVCIMYDLTTVGSGNLSTSGWFHVDNGKIDSVRSFFDASKLAQGRAEQVSDPVTDRRLAEGATILPFAFPVLFSAEMQIAEWDSAR